MYLYIYIKDLLFVALYKNKKMVRDFSTYVHKNKLNGTIPQPCKAWRA